MKHSNSAELYNPATGTWTRTGSLNTARGGQTATLLPNGQVLVAGGYGTTNVLSSAELYNPATGTWTTTGSLNTARYLHTATLLPNGQVLIAGGSGTNYLSSAELYNPATGTWTATGSMTTNRYNHTATLLPNGMVLVAGGTYAGIVGVLYSAELYNPATGTWTATGSLKTAREFHTATLLSNGEVLVAGGWNEVVPFSPVIISSSELYNPATGTWTVTNSLNTARYSHTATLLPNGMVLAAGGYGTNYLSSSELYNPATGTWTVTGPMSTAHFVDTATLLPNGKVLVAGGEYYNGSSWVFIPVAELYNPATGIWTATGSLTTARAVHTATLLPNGEVLVAGGLNSSSVPTASTELYNVGLGFSASWQPQIASFTSPLYPRSSLVLTGSQFRGISEGSGGNGSQDSPADYPVVQLRSLGNEQTVFLLTTNWSTNSVTSAPVTNFPPGYALVTVFVNGIPSSAQTVLINNTLPSAPTLYISHSSNTVMVYYWQAVSGWTLQQNSNLTTPTGWTSSSGVTTANGTNYLNLTLPTGNLFFRLVNP